MTVSGTGVTGTAAAAVFKFFEWRRVDELPASDSELPEECDPLYSESLR